jgi:Tol biopolymer transport system component
VTLDAAVNLTRHPSADLRPTFSKDGKTIAFSSDRGSVATGHPASRRRDGDIYAMDADGGHVRQLTHAPGWDGSPVWSNDGRDIYFYSKRDGTLRIWAMHADGSEAPPISPAGVLAMSPAPLGAGRVAFATKIGADDQARWRIVSVKADGSDQRLESDSDSDYWGPSSIANTGAVLCHGTGPVQDAPPGPTLTGRVYLGAGPLVVAGAPFASKVPDRQVAVYPLRGFSMAVHPFRDAMIHTAPLGRFPGAAKGPRVLLSDIRGGRSRELFTIEPAQAPWTGMSWSRTGEWVAYMAGQMFGPPTSEADIWKMRPDGAARVNLTPDSPGNDGFPDFAGDGRRIVFRSGRTGNYDIHVMDADGGRVRNLTNHPANDTFPTFSPRNDEVAFSSNRDGDLDPKTGVRTYDIYTLRLGADGTPGTLTRITESAGQDAHSHYSPDGEWIVFASERGGINDEEPLVMEVLFAPQLYGEIYACRLKDRLTIRLTHNKWEGGFPNWVGPVTEAAGQVFR